MMPVEAAEKLLPPAKPRHSLVAFLQGLGIGDLDLAREHDTGCDIMLERHRDATLLDPRADDPTAKR